MLDEIRAELAAGFDPRIVLFGQYGPNEKDQPVVVGQDPHDVRQKPNPAVQPLLGIIALHLAPQALGESGERKDVIKGGLEVFDYLGSLSSNASMARSNCEYTLAASGLS